MRPDPDETEKRTNEIGTILPLLETVPDIAGHTVTTDALLTQRALATYLLGRGADYLFTVKGNQPNMLDDIRLTLDEHIAQRAPDFTDESPKPEHGRRERRSIWVSSALNDYLDFPGVGQVFAIGRQTVEVNSANNGKRTVIESWSAPALQTRPARPGSLTISIRSPLRHSMTRGEQQWGFLTRAVHDRERAGTRSMAVLRHLSST